MHVASALPHGLAMGLAGWLWTGVGGPREVCGVTCVCVCVCVCVRERERELGGSENSEGWELESLWGWMGPRRRGQRRLSEPGCLSAAGVKVSSGPRD